ncbi:MAG: hypothetical protein U5K79_23185 [Cyclobacteriaceae bacterium]|nr:hypothetical protein [Cyclobacteriaceae bacterium]
MSQSPLIAVVMDNPDYACSGVNFTGILNPTISGGSDNDVNQANYSIVWTSIASGLPTAVDADQPRHRPASRRLPHHGYGQYRL